MRESHKDKDDLKDELARLKQNLATLMDRVKEMVMKDQLLQKRVTQLEEENLGFKKHITNFRKDMMEKNEAIEALKKEIKVLKSKGTQQTTDADIAGQSRPPGSLKFTGVDIVIRSVEEIEELRRKLQQQQNCAYCESNQRPASFDCKDTDGEDCEGYCQDKSDDLEDLYSWNIKQFRKKNSGFDRMKVIHFVSYYLTSQDAGMEYVGLNVSGKLKSYF